MNRRKFLSGVGASILFMPPRVFGLQHSETHAPAMIPKPPCPATYSLSIDPITLEISPGVNIKTIAYNGQVPGPLIKVKQGAPISIDVTNNSGREDIVHWHGLRTDVINDGAMEEGSAMIGNGETLRYNLAPDPAGTRWYHTHAMAGADLSKGQYTGQFGFFIVEGNADPGDYGQEAYLAIHHWEPYFAPMAEVMQEQSSQHPAGQGSDVAYKYATINAHRLGAGEPLRVKKGQRSCSICSMRVRPIM